MPVKSLVLAAMLAGSLSIFGQTEKPKQPVEKSTTAEMHGGIELGARVVRAIALRISETEDGGALQVVFSSSENFSADSHLKDGKLTPNYIAEAADAVGKLFQQLRVKYKAPENQIHILGLSEFNEQNLDELQAAIFKATGRSIKFINSETEIELSIAGTIPRRHRVGNKVFDNRSVSLLLDVGVRNVRGGYQQLVSRPEVPPDYEFLTWHIPKGSDALAAEISKAAGEAADIPSFSKAAEATGQSYIRNLFQTIPSQSPGLLGRKRLYLTGTIVWAMMTLLHPEDQSNYTTVSMDDIKQFYARALADPESLMNPDLSKISDEKLRNESRKARDQVKQLFSPKSLIAGAVLLHGTASEMDFQNRTVIYPRYAWLARIISYVRLRPEG
jgi:hypothetical protein